MDPRVKPAGYNEEHGSQRATVKTKLTLNDLLDLFEEGLLAWFRQEK